MKTISLRGLLAAIYAGTCKHYKFSQIKKIKVFHNKKVIEIIKELNHNFKENFQDFKGYYLYGSMVKGNYYKDSDIDLVAIFDKVDWDKTFEISGKNPIMM